MQTLGGRMKQFTDRFLASIKPHEKKIVLREKRGFAFQILPSGSKSFLYIFELCRRKGYFHLGNYPAMSLAEARIAYNNAYNLVKRGIDPRDQRKSATEELNKEREKAEEKSNVADLLKRYTFNSLIDEGIPDGYTPITVEQLITVYYVFYSKVNHSPMIRRNFLYTVQSGIIPSIGKKLLTEVRRKDAIALIQDIASRAPGQAGNVLRAGRQVFEYALQNEWVEYQPFLRITKAVPKARPKSRE